jgi:hypothetical protein
MFTLVEGRVNVPIRETCDQPCPTSFRAAQASELTSNGHKSQNHNLQSLPLLAAL